jgi:hypothetical protein
MNDYETTAKEQFKAFFWNKTHNCDACANKIVEIIGETRSRTVRYKFSSPVLQCDTHRVCEIIGTDRDNPTVIDISMLQFVFRRTYRETPEQTTFKNGEISMYGFLNDLTTEPSNFIGPKYFTDVGSVGELPQFFILDAKTRDKILRKPWFVGPRNDYPLSPYMQPVLEPGQQ